MVAELTKQRDSFKDATEYNKRRAEDAEKQRDELLADVAEEAALREKLATLLAKTAVALKRPEAELFRHSWHDLAEVAASVVKQRDELLAFAEEVRRSGDTRLASMAIAAIASAKGGAGGKPTPAASCLPGVKLEDLQK